MRLAWLALLLSVTLAGCPASPLPFDDTLAAERLARQVENRQKLFVNKVGDELVWSDGAILERGKAFPKQLAELIAKPTEQKDVLTFLNDVERRQGEWHPARIQRLGTGDFDCQVNDGMVAIDVNCIYVNYLESRWRKAGFKLRAPLEPILLVEDGHVRAALMPVKK
jgi:hypothetical protein